MFFLGSIFPTDTIEKEIVDKLAGLFIEMGQWFYRLYENDEFDFGQNSDFIEKGKMIGQKIHKYRKIKITFSKIIKLKIRNLW